MQVALSQRSRSGVWALLLVFFLSLFYVEEAEARRGRRGRGVRRGGARGVLARGPRRRGGRQVARRGRGRRNRNNVVEVPGIGVDQNGNLDLGTANALPPDNLGLSLVSNNIAVSSNGSFFEINPGFVRNGVILDSRAAIRQPLVGANGQIFSGALGAMLPETELQVRALNQGEIPSVAGVQDGVLSLRRR